MGHTKGEWIADVPFKCMLDGVNCYQGDIASESGQMLGIILGKTKAQQEANAKLMVASPKLLEHSLKLIQQIEKSDYVEPLGHNIKMNRAFIKLKEAIKSME